MHLVQQYFVLYETPPPSKLPFKLKGSVELMLQMEPKRKHTLSAKTETCDKLEDQTPFAFPGMKEALCHIVGVFQGTGRTANYNPFNLSVTDDFTFPYKQVSYILQDHASGLEDEEAQLFSSFGVVEPPLYSASLPVISTTLEGAVMEEILRQESFHLQASDPNISDQMFQTIATREKRWNRRLWRNFRRQLYENRCRIEQAIVPLLAHSAAMHLGFSLSSSSLKQHKLQFASNVEDEELKVHISSLLKLSTGLWIVSSSGENLFMVDPTHKNNKDSSQAAYTKDKSETGDTSRIHKQTPPVHHSNMSTSTSGYHKTEKESSSLFGNQTREDTDSNYPSVAGMSNEERLAWIEKVKRLEHQNALLIQRIQQLEDERDRYLASTENHKLEPNTDGQEDNYYDELNRILHNIDNSVYREWEVVDKSQGDFLL